jgi:hypothetical protein
MGSLRLSMKSYPELMKEVVKKKRSVRSVDEAKSVLGLHYTAGLHTSRSVDEAN